MAEWSKAPVLKTGIRMYREFKSRLFWMNLKKYLQYLQNQNTQKLILNKPMLYQILYKEEFDKDLYAINYYTVFLIFKFSLLRPKELINILGTDHKINKLFYIYFFFYNKNKIIDKFWILHLNYRLFTKYFLYCVKDEKYFKRYEQISWDKKFLRLFHLGVKKMLIQEKWLSGRKQ